MATTILEHSKISPLPNSPAEFSLPITFFDMIWCYTLPATQNVLFFQFPCSKSRFLDAIIPDLKNSLSLTLTHFLPFAGNIVHPLNPEKKSILRYESGDSVSFIVSESSANFNRFIGNKPRVSDEFYDFVPQLPPAKRQDDKNLNTSHSENSNISCPVLALQVTLFPEQGLCIGIATHHSVTDGSTLTAFIQSWALINCSSSKNDGDDNISTKLAKRNILPFYDRNNVMDLNGLDSLYWDLIVKHSWQVEPPPPQFPTNKLRATIVLKKDEIHKLKNFVLSKSPFLAHLSSFTVSCALIWFCSAKSAAPGGEDVEDDEPDYLCFLADCRGRLNPPLPANYFGNCVTPVKAKLKHGELKSPDGFVMAATAIGEAIRENMGSEKGILDVAEKWPEERDRLIRKRQCWVAGSSRLDFYAAEYGWGKPKKYEMLSIDGGRAIIVAKSRDFEGGLEIGFSMTAVQMDAFTTVLNEFPGNLLAMKRLHCICSSSVSSSL